MGWLNKITKGLFGEDAPTQPEQKKKLYGGFPDAPPGAGSAAEDAPAKPKARKIVSAPKLVDEEDKLTWSSDVAIKAQVSKDRRSCTLFTDRPMLDGYSAWYSDPASAPGSPLAEKLFALDDVASMMIHNSTLTINAFGDLSVEDWRKLCEAVGKIIRTQLLGGYPVVAPGYVESIPAEELIRERLEQVIRDDINPSVSAHGGVITLERVEGNSVYITMGGGCQGCSAAAITLKEGIYRSFRTAVPQIGAILDETDHDAGVNPFFTEPVPGV